MEKQELNEYLEEHYLDEEAAAIKELIGFGINDAIAMDCMSSRTIEEMEIVLTFLRRYGNMLDIK